VTALAVFGILAKTFASKPKRAEKREKAEIIRQLLELSERESRISAPASPPSSGFRSASTSVARRNSLPKGAHRELKSERRNSPMSHDSSAPLRPNAADAEIEEQVRRRAYELYQARGGVGGNATDDWRQARDEVLSHKARATKRKSRVP
jgi:hypothetical protein